MPFCLPLPSSSNHLLSLDFLCLSFWLLKMKVARGVKDSGGKQKTQDDCFDYKSLQQQNRGEAVAAGALKQRIMVPATQWRSRKALDDFVNMVSIHRAERNPLSERSTVGNGDERIVANGALPVKVVAQKPAHKKATVKTSPRLLN